ncbi:MBL fold metallo-hydrolase [Verrucomicrobia bacterium]|nr:MBL fold metallo-hydrolase [Verrucomicrobiota bacterium]
MQKEFDNERCLPSLNVLGWSLLLSTVSLLGGQEDRRLDIYWIDVVGGAATLIVTPAGEATLIDTGMPRDRDVNRIEACVREVAGLERIDNVLISHYDLDHYGGAAKLSKRIPIVNLYDNGRFDGMRNDPGEAYFSLESERKYVLDPGDIVPLQQAANSARVKLRCVATRMEFVEPTISALARKTDCNLVELRDSDSSENANSMVLVLEFGQFQFYNATDLTWNLETQLVCPYNLIGEVDVYQTTHHGLDRSNHPIVIETIKPAVAIMNNGPTKGCQSEMFAALKAANSIETIYQVHKNQRADGVVNNTELQFIANTKKGSSGNLIKLSVDPSGESYTVSIPATGHSKTFRTR